MLSKIVTGIAVIAAIGCGFLYYMLDAAKAREALATQQLAVALAAQAETKKTLDTLKADYERVNTQSINFEKTNRELSASAAQLRKDLENVDTNCVLGADTADRLNRFLRPDGAQGGGSGPASPPR